MSAQSMLVPLSAVALLAGAAPAAEPAAGPLKVFILAGQSNMQGWGRLTTADWLGADPKHGGLLKKIKAADGKWIERDDVSVWYNRSGKVKKGALTAGYGADDNHMGPELMFGAVMGDHFGEPVLLIKTAWGGQSLAINFRPPGAGDPMLPPAKAGATPPQPGAKYREMIEEVRKVVGDLKTHFPQYAGREVQLSGFFWFQGWNDMINREYTAEYEKNMVAFIQDVRRDLKAPKLPFVIAVMGVDGKKAGANIETFRKAQNAAGARPEFAGNVACVQTAEYWDEEAAEFLTKHWVKRTWSSPEAKAKFETMGSQPPYHYLGSAKILSLIGYGCAQAMKELIGKGK